MSATIMRGVLDQMQSQVQQVSGYTQKKETNPVQGISFSDSLLNSISEINKLQVDAKNLSQQWMSGESDIGLNDVMLAMQKSSVSFSFGMQVRNKMISAYQEIMNTPV
ncbi:flagellar hook-basal body complex protein FliE [Pantoea agglomerans]|jgi:flagellar hook-basal body complex protein FliE|uniref:flagellar hook-basal body complex protein FliE n=1 Tax=Enterobacter agglomerans TaxID=549 RepID=UPI0010457FE2|nr:flagellar hook-basal body complex protein FliE [Pantoea agglomerans]MDQ0431110.1 flagellar hook-basal body complex protein FliE [Pantoea agglomerans]TCZ24215.1 flagellar hook-basal body complex protein FliE [Pantoea agglomerans]